MDIGTMNVEAVQGLIDRVQALEIDNNRLRAEMVRPNTPLAESLMDRVQALEMENNRLRTDMIHSNATINAPMFTGRSKIDYKVIPRPEKYSGIREGRKVKEFCRKIRRYLKCLENVDPSLYLDIVAGFLTGSADTWYTRWERQNPKGDVDDMLEALVCHFAPSNTTHEARQKLSNLKQMSSVQKYSEKFREILEEIEDIEEAEAKTCYLNGLKERIETEVSLRDLDDTKSLDEIERISLQVDNILFKRNFRRSDFRPKSSQDSSGSSPMQGVQLGNLSLEDAKKYSSEKRCWKCHQQNKHAEGCSSKYAFKSNVFSLESKDGGDEPDLE